jgi:hypothetical protein
VMPEPEGSSPHLWEPTTGPYPEPDESILNLPSSQPVSLRSIVIPFSNLCLTLPSGLFPSDVPTKTLYTSVPSPPQHGVSSGLDGGDVLQIWRVAANILNKQLWTADRGWPSSLWVGWGLTTPPS